jgi:hypothetical protein
MTLNSTIEYRFSSRPNLAGASGEKGQAVVSPSYFCTFSRHFFKNARLFALERVAFYFSSLLSTPGIRSAARGR